MAVQHPPRNIHLVVFDLDGTLVDAYQAIADSINHMMRVTGRPRQSLRTVKRSVGHGVDSLIRYFVEEDQAVEALAIFRAHHDKRLRQKVRLLPGVKQLLPFLKKQGCVLAIASNRPTRFCRLILKSTKIEHYFDQVVCGDAVKDPKPSPDMLKVILKKTGVRASEAVYVGDMAVDILCGRRAGVFTLGVPTGSCTRSELVAVHPDRLVTHVSRVRDLFANKRRS